MVHKSNCESIWIFVARGHCLMHVAIALWWDSQSIFMHSLLFNLSFCLCHNPLQCSGALLLCSLWGVFLRIGPILGSHSSSAASDSEIAFIADWSARISSFSTEFNSRPILSFWPQTWPVSTISSWFKTSRNIDRGRSWCVLTLDQNRSAFYSSNNCFVVCPKSHFCFRFEVLLYYVKNHHARVHWHCICAKGIYYGYFSSDSPVACCKYLFVSGGYPAKSVCISESTVADDCDFFFTGNCIG